MAYDITGIVEASSNRSETQDIIGKSAFFDAHILTYHDEALRVWRSVTRRYTKKEEELDIPYSLAESAKLYAVDALSIAGPLVRNDRDIFTIAEFFCVFYLVVHYFDDHVEHRDKFYSKFDFSQNNSIDTQHGAAPFSFILISFSILGDLLRDIDSLDAESRYQILQSVYTALALQTRYFAAERQHNLDVMEVLEIKQRQVSGKTLSLLGDILGRYLQYDTDKSQLLQCGLMYLGSLTQITDDIRDLSIDTALRNANIVTACYRLGKLAGVAQLASIYNKEVTHAKKYLVGFYDTAELSTLLSLPFYPFMVNKQELEGAPKV